MGTAHPGPATGYAAPTGYDQLHRAPEYLVRTLAAVIHVPGRPGGPPPGSPEYARQVTEAARLYADQIWAEAAHVGAVWATARGLVRFEVTAERFDELKRKCG